MKPNPQPVRLGQSAADRSGQYSGKIAYISPDGEYATVETADGAAFSNHVTQLDISETAPDPLAGADGRAALSVLFSNGLIPQADADDMLRTLVQRHPRLASLVAEISSPAVTPPSGRRALKGWC